MTDRPRAFVAADLGTATAVLSLIARPAGRWRLLGSLAVPAWIDTATALSLLVDRTIATDSDLAAAVGLVRGQEPDLPRVVARTEVPPVLGVVAASPRGAAAAAAVATRAGWRVRAASLSADGPLGLGDVLLSGELETVLAAADDPAGADERGALAEVVAAVAAAAGRRPELTVILAGAAGDAASRHDELSGTGVVGADASRESKAGAAPSAEAASSVSGPAMGASPPARTVLFAPAAARGARPGDALRDVLDGLRCAPDDGRRAIARSVGSLARLWDRTVEVVEVGASGGLRVVARPTGAGGKPDVRWAAPADGAIAPRAVDDALVDGVLAWSTTPLDRHRLRDRLVDLAASPWAEAHGDGALLRLAAARAALARLVAATPDLSAAPAPDLLVASGGAFAVAPGPAVALALADTVRRAGASQLALDHARLLAPIGTIADDGEREELLADLSDDLLAPLGTLVSPAIARSGRSAGTLTVQGTSGEAVLELVPGGIELVDLPPGERAEAVFAFREAVVLGTRGKRFSVDVAGGLSGLLVDLRGVPLTLPERAERRRELLDAWQRALWAGLEE